jgi:hypothetical protein
LRRKKSAINSDGSLRLDEAKPRVAEDDTGRGDWLHARGGSAGEVVLARGTAAEEQTLEKKATTLNGMPASPKVDEARVQALARQFDVPESCIVELRNQKASGALNTTVLHNFALPP